MPPPRPIVQPPKHGRDRCSRTGWLAAVIVAAVALVYWPTLRAPFLFDDLDAILRNPTIRQLESLDSLSPPTNGSTTTGRPVVNLSFALNFAISGENPWSYHALNLLIHAAAALTLFGLVRRTLNSPALRGRFGPAASKLAFFSALLWAVHPLATESVSCAAQRTESLSGLFYLLTLYGFARGIEAPRWFALSSAACLLGMATKEILVTAPLVALLYDRTFFAGSFAGAIRARAKIHLCLAATWLVLLVLVARAGGTRGSAAGFALGISAWNYLLTQCEALVLYLKLTVWPHPLVLDYGTAVVHSPTEVWWQGLLVLALLGATIVALVRRPLLGFAGAWCFLILAPSSSFIPLVTQTIAEHRMYLPLAGLLVLLTLGLHHLLGNRTGLALVSVTLLAGAAAFARNRDYASEIQLWQDNVAHRPHARVLTALGVALVHAGRPAEALPCFERALILDPSHLSALRNRALALLQLGRATEAAAILAALPAREPGEAAEMFALGNAFVREKKFAEAAAAYARTLALEPDHAAAHANLGNIRLLEGRVPEAIAEYETVLRLRPDDARARENLQLAREALH